jgi:hypothetical protein
MRSSWAETPPTASRANRLMLFLPTLIETLERHEHLLIPEECRKQLLSISAAMVDRLLSSQRKLERC